MTVEYRPPKRGASPLLIGLAGPSGGGKTYSALRVARGLADDKPFAVLDTENGRALHYADAFPDMRHGRLDAPFSPAAYTEAIRDADAAGFPVIVVDSSSHEWEGEGGVLEMQELEFARMGSKEGARMASWIAPKKEHKKMVRALLQVKAHVILCMRAEDKVNGKTEVRAKETLTSILGWIPICERRLPFELTMSLLVTPDAPGVPKPIKLQEQHKPFVPLDQPLSENTGRQLAAWAAGTSPNSGGNAGTGDATSGDPNEQASRHGAPAPATEVTPSEVVSPADSGVEPASPDDIFTLTARLVAASSKPQEAAYMIEMKAQEQTAEEHLAWLKEQERKRFAGARGGDA
jgi:hypothetical protein